jgi:hypothetical protein
MVDVASPTLTEVVHTYPAPGLYFPTIIVTDAQGGPFTATTVVNILV